MLALGVTLQAGATGAVRAIKMSATLTTGRGHESVGGREASARVILASESTDGNARTECAALVKRPGIETNDKGEAPHM